MTVSTTRNKNSFAAFLIAVFAIFGGVVESAPSAQAAGAPCTVSGATLHGKHQMAMRFISMNEVESAVKKNCNIAKWQPEERTWYYPSPYGYEPVVVLNTSRQVVTAWWSKLLYF